ncbi:hypothetical protein X777_05364 [Ooceraea biroi]|uniref:Uncharacterized protein n=1 Tax=Ooceraea biroi TaxID=2015173 RepID=A0A026WG96_OOCBI|nr:hypothetical protein X777_05364 [Ooceraea biroi]
MHYWAEDNPHWLRQVQHQHPWTVNVWCGIIGNHIIGPFFIEGTLNEQKYANFLRHELQILLHDVPLGHRIRM